MCTESGRCLLQQIPLLPIGRLGEWASYLLAAWSVVIPRGRIALYRSCEVWRTRGDIWPRPVSQTSRSVAVSTVPYSRWAVFAERSDSSACYGNVKENGRSGFSFQCQEAIWTSLLRCQNSRGLLLHGLRTAPAESQAKNICGDGVQARLEERNQSPAPHQNYSGAHRAPPLAASQPRREATPTRAAGTAHRPRLAPAALCSARLILLPAHVLLFLFPGLVTDNQL